MALGAGTKRTVACLLVGLGTLLIVAALLLPTYAMGQLAKTPLDLEITTIAKNRPDKPSEVLDAKSLSSGTGPAKIDRTVTLLSQRFLTVEDPSDKNDMTIQAGQTLRNIDKKGDTGLLSALIDRVTIDRKDGMPVGTDPNGSIASSVNSKGESVAEPVQHEGLQYRFPVGTEQKTYPYFDINARKTFDMNFVEETEVNDLKVYHFTQDVPPTDLAKISNAPTNRVELPAAKWGVEGGDNPISMDRYYSNTRDVWVEPKTGTIINGSEQMHMYYSRDGAKPEVTALNSTLEFDGNTVDSQISEAKYYMDELSLYGRVLPIVFGVVGVIVLAVGLILGLRGGGGPTLVQRRSAPSGPAPDDAPTEQIDLGKNP